MTWKLGCGTVSSTTLRAHMFKLRPTQRQDCQLCSEEKEDTHWMSSSGMACKRYRTLGHMFWNPRVWKPWGYMI